MRLFGRRPLVTDDMADWILDCADWAEETGRMGRRLILPTKDDFRAPGGEGPEVARRVADDIARHMGLADRAFRVEPIDALPAEHRHQYGQLSAVAGQYWHDADEPLITYDPAMMARPLPFIATMAHELMHLALADAVDEVPGGDAVHELATDLLTIFAGFGVLQMTGAAQAGWAGYMTQDSRAWALAVFLRRTGGAPETATPWLDPRDRTRLARALSDPRVA